MSTTWTEEPGSDYLDTVALLQEEVARLEAELLRRDEAGSEGPPESQGGPTAGDADAEARIGEMTGLLAERDEVIGLLSEQLAAFEEAGAARSAEWEQLDRWVRELEERIDREGARGRDPDEASRQAEALRERLEGQERAWDAERARLVCEIDRLRSRLAESAGTSGDPAIAALEAENQRLRDECRRLANFEVAADEAEALRERANDLRERLDRAEDDRARVLIEHQAELAALRASLAGSKASAGAGSELSADERIRALRLHLREVHEQEERERAERQLSTRISRLWRRT